MKEGVREVVGYGDTSSRSYNLIFKSKYRIPFCNTYIQELLKVEARAKINEKKVLLRGAIGDNLMT